MLSDCELQFHIPVDYIPLVDSISLDDSSNLKQSKESLWPRVYDAEYSSLRWMGGKKEI